MVTRTEPRKTTCIPGLNDEFRLMLKQSRIDVALWIWHPGQYFRGIPCAAEANADQVSVVMTVKKAVQNAWRYEKNIGRGLTCAISKNIRLLHVQCSQQLVYFAFFL